VNQQGILDRIRNIIRNLFYLLGRFLGDKVTGLLKEMIENFLEGWTQGRMPVKE